MRIFVGTTAIVGLAVVLGWGAMPKLQRVRPDFSLARYEPTLDQVPIHISEFAPLAAPLATPSCADNRPPEALATPDPLLQWNDSRVRVSFIVNTQGHVESPFILESGGIEEDEVILNAVRFWRFRPALCNGVPTQVEARVRFIEQSSSK